MSRSAGTVAQIERLSLLYPEFAEDLSDALTYADTKPDIALFKLRRVLEAVVETAYTNFTGLPLPEDTSPSALLAEPALATQIPRFILDTMYTLKRDGNRAVHRQPITSSNAWSGLTSVREILEWSSSWWPRGSTEKKREALSRSRPLGNPVKNPPPVSSRGEPLTALFVLLIGTPILTVAGAGIVMLLEYFFMYRSLMNATGPTGPAQAFIIVGAVGGAVFGVVSALKIFRDDP